MVKVGFIVEGDTEKKVIYSDSFKQLCSQNQIELLPTVFPPKGKRGKDVFKDIEKLNSFINILKDEGAIVIFVIRDLEDLDCIIEARNEIKNDEVVKIIVVKTMESWFLADNQAIKSFLKDEGFYCEFPEQIEKPFDEIRRINIEKNKRGLSDKLIFAGNMLRCGFTIENAAKHPNCPSAKYFLNKLETINNSI